MTERGKTRIAVIFGGRSGEHDVSCKSALSVMQHLDRERYQVVPVRITIDGVWIVGQDEPNTASTLDLDGLLAQTRAADGTVHPLPITSISDALAALRDVDVAFPCLHGPYGEDGTIQALLELAGLPYLGNGVLASAVSMDKEFTKKILVSEGIEVADGVVLRRAGETVSQADRERLGLPVFVKPSRAGSSIGVSRVDDWADLDAAIELARRSDPKVLVEAAVPGREVDIGVLEFPDGRVEAGPSLEIRVPDGFEFFDFEAKYTDVGTVFEIPAKLSPAVTAAVEECAVTAFRALDCTGLLRVDFFLRETPDGVVPVINEVNTFPGFTSMSQFPQMWAAAGVSYSELLDVMVETALLRQHPTPQVLLPE
ncbi:D-alanine-D-alanine ligase [Catenuloplanes nepalensis]|uniref:D-alanine--D-alanine ligase n=1 Tax=Catenuloplanes nepalensis TaxID=587533 RepID=A0ABT9N4Y6_9ACTN|nr:D-alanine--D-alanine ligase family protein [Catenuloplanes nepalensis]MDP9798775.1 D-alanine-D-alanine ligase [Catenuloplanes nepalensis]